MVVHQTIKKKILKLNKISNFGKGDLTGTTVYLKNIENSKLKDKEITKFLGRVCNTTLAIEADGCYDPIVIPETYEYSFNVTSMDNYEY